MRAIGNLIWFVFGGVVMGLAWWLAGVIACLTIVGIPWAKSCFVMGRLAFFPFGKEIIARDDLTLREDIGTGPLGFLGNVIWFLFAGLWLAIGHLISAVLCCLTIIGIPFGMQHVKMAVMALAPVGKTVISKETAQAVRVDNARNRRYSMR